MTETRSDEPMRVPQSKLNRPRLGRSVIDRTWLFERPATPLAGMTTASTGAGDDQADVVVTLLSAPAGAGKTTLMSSWAKNRAERGHPVAWVSLDDHDNDRVLFWTGVLAAVRVATGDMRGIAASTGTDDRPVDELSDGRALMQLEALVGAAQAPVWLFLDDLHAISATDVLTDVADLLRGLPDGLNLVLATRRDPAVALHRLRLAGRLREIRADDLALDRSEVRALLVDHGVTLEEIPLSLLMDRTEGWAAGVRLAALTLAGAEDPQSLVQRFAGDERAVAEYLAAEIVTRLDPAARELIRLCAVPEQLTGELAVAVTGDPSAAVLLERLYRDNVLVVRLVESSGWYRMHSLLRGYLVGELRRSEPRLLETAHARTAAWFAENGNLVWAINHAVAAGDDELATRMITVHGPRLLADGRARVLHRLIGASSATVQSDVDVQGLATLTGLELGTPPPIPLPHPRSPADEDEPDADGPLPGSGAPPLRALVTLQQARHGDLGSSDTALAASALVSEGRSDTRASCSGSTAEWSP